MSDQELNNQLDEYTQNRNDNPGTNQSFPSKSGSEPIVQVKNPNTMTGKGSNT
jgi:hypothetical protein